MIGMDKIKAVNIGLEAGFIKISLEGVGHSFYYGECNIVRNHRYQGLLFFGGQSPSTYILVPSATIQSIIYHELNTQIKITPVLHLGSCSAQAVNRCYKEKTHPIPLYDEHVRDNAIILNGEKVTPFDILIHHLSRIHRVNSMMDKKMYEFYMHELIPFFERLKIFAEQNMNNFQDIEFLIQADRLFEKVSEMQLYNIDTYRNLFSLLVMNEPPIDRPDCQFIPTLGFQKCCALLLTAFSQCPDEYLKAYKINKLDFLESLNKLPSTWHYEILMYLRQCQQKKLSECQQEDFKQALIEMQLIETPKPNDYLTMYPLTRRGALMHTEQANLRIAFEELNLRESSTAAKP